MIIGSFQFSTTIPEINPIQASRFPAITPHVVPYRCHAFADPVTHHHSSFTIPLSLFTSYATFPP
jgi:hypothetical protein